MNDNLTVGEIKTNIKHVVFSLWVILQFFNSFILLSSTFVVTMALVAYNSRWELCLWAFVSLALATSASFHYSRKMMEDDYNNSHKD